MYLQNDKCKLRQITYSEDKLVFVKLSVQAAIYLFYYVQIKYMVFYNYILPYLILCHFTFYAAGKPHINYL